MFDCIRTDYDQEQILITIMFTNYCCFQCKYCIENLAYDNCNKTNVNISKVYLFLDYVNNCYPTKIINLEIYGGEPTLHPLIIDFCQTVRLSRKYIHEIDIYTNFSSNIACYKILQALNCHLSLTYHYSFCDQDTFIQKLSKLKLQSNLVSVNVMYENDNINEILSMYNVLKHKDIKLELGLVFSTNRHKSTYAKHDYLKFLFLNSLYNEKFYYIADGKNFEVNISDSLNFYHCKCTAGRNSLFISPDSKIYPCNIYYRFKDKNDIGISIDEAVSNNLYIFNCTTCIHKECLPCIPIKITNLTTLNFINRKHLFEIEG